MDALLGGAILSTADTVLSALQLVKLRKGANLAFSCTILISVNEKLAMDDYAIKISYQNKLDTEGNVTLSAAQQVAEVAVETGRTQTFGHWFQNRHAVLLH